MPKQKQTQSVKPKIVKKKVKKVTKKVVTKKKPTRQSVVAGTVIHKKAMVAALRSSLGNVSLACDKTGVGRATYYEWLKKDAEFRHSVETIEDIAIDFVEAQLYKLIKLGCEKSIMFYLKTKGSVRGYGDKKELIHSAKITGDMKKLTDEELEEIIEG